MLKIFFSKDNFLGAMKTVVIFDPTSAAMAAVFHHQMHIPLHVCKKFLSILMHPPVQWEINSSSQKRALLALYNLFTEFFYFLISKILMTYLRELQVNFLLIFFYLL